MGIANFLSEKKNLSILIYDPSGNILDVTFISGSSGQLLQKSNQSFIFNFSIDNMNIEYLSFQIKAKQSDRIDLDIKLFDTNEVLLKKRSCSIIS